MPDPGSHKSLCALGLAHTNVACRGGPAQAALGRGEPSHIPMPVLADSPHCTVLGSAVRF